MVTCFGADSDGVEEGGIWGTRRLIRRAARVKRTCSGGRTVGPVELLCLAGSRRDGFLLHGLLVLLPFLFRASAQRHLSTISLGRVFSLGPDCCPNNDSL